MDAGGQCAGDTCAVVRVYNQPARVGQRANKLGRLVAHLSFRMLGKVVATVPRAYWAERVSNEVSLDVGVEQAIILGVVDGDHWMAMANSFTMPARYRSGLVIHPRKKPILMSSKIWKLRCP